VALSRGARFIFSFIALSVLVSVAAAAAMVFLATRGPDVADDSVLWLRVPGNLIEQEPDHLLGQLVGRGETVGAVVETLRKAKVDSRVRAVVLAPPLEPGLWGKAQEIRDAVRDFRTSGKPVAAWLEYGGGQQYYLATACDEIFLAPTSPLDLVGVATYELFAREALDRIGAFPDMLHAGDFKTAANVYTETTFTPAHREMSESLNRDLYAQLVDGIAEGRGLPAPVVRALIDDGPFLPDDAVRRRLVDGLAYEDEVLERLADGGDAPARLSYDEYRGVDPATLGLDDGPSIAVVYAAGPITFGEGGSDGFGGSVVGSQALIEALRAAREDASIEAVVLRIDSPGGSAVASDLIWREIVLTREAKPVVASMSDLAASGGYYLAMPASVIVAQPATLTGSIGVVAGKLALGGALDKLGLRVESVSEGRMADMHSIVTPYSDEARVRVQALIDAFYDEFLDKAADGRSMSREAVHAVAQGRVWTGRQARDAGLVDELGGLRRAVAAAKELAGIDADQEVTLRPYPRPKSLIETLAESLAIRAAVGVGWPTAPAVRLGAAAAAPFRLFRPGEPLALMPFVYVPQGGA